MSTLENLAWARRELQEERDHLLNLMVSQLRSYGGLDFLYDVTKARPVGDPDPLGRLGKVLVLIAGLRDVEKALAAELAAERDGAQ